MNAKTMEVITRHGETLLRAFPNATEKTQWFEIEVMNCKLQSNSSRPRRQVHQILATSADEARALAPKVLNYLFNAGTYIGTVEMTAIKPAAKTDKATARPWHYAISSQLEILPENAVMENGDIVRGHAIAIIPKDSPIENARLIVKAVNEHAALVAVAEAAKQMDDSGNYTERLHEALANLAAVQKRGGK